MKKYKLIILDRDGVINEDTPFYIKSPGEWIPIQNSLKAIAKINAAGIKVVVASNQSGIGRGYFSAETLSLIHKKMQDELAKVGGHLDGIYFCPHHPDENCNCRKPKAGLLKKILQDFAAKPNETLMVGDSLKDIQAANKIGCDSVLVKTGKGASMLKNHPEELKKTPVFLDLFLLVKELTE